MICDPREAVGPGWSPALQQLAQDRGWAVLQAAAAAIRPGMTDLEGKALVDRMIADSGAEQLWHASQVRFGTNTTLPFGKVPEHQHVLADGDIFFLDIGPVYEGHEADIGAAFVLGEASPHARIAADCREVFLAVKAHWQATGATGEALYQVAKAEAEARSWTLALTGASGHRLGDFPHHIHHRGKLVDFKAIPSPARWILEIHLIDAASGVGAFYEDLL